ncbi:phage tail tape measure protein [Tepidibacter formicigenes]|uniref:Phage tail tape measure protein, TP901 family, core region n=1 Tax=Tepidibacter formicigenes DSM 15518 TaxID=1123349 RepID=A0A1M6LSY3_9FIRM|nr:phage tail tape measure protein [Tepidibacter formicigenes]SHJ74212.1 phage tail tape measure protein, TP901 family, core region [Tepidibacter formicigenes DSM 15518]
MAGGRKEYELLFKLKAALGSNFNSSFTSALNTTRQLQGTLTRINSLSGKIDGYKKQSNAVEKSRQKLAELTAEHERLQQEMSQTETPSESLRRRFERNARQIEATTTRIEEQERRLGELGEELRSAGVNTNNLETANERLARSYQSVQRSQEELSRINTAQRKNAAAIANTRTQLVGTVGVVSAIGAAFYAGPVKSAKDFESSMADVAKVVDGLKDDTTGKLTKEYYLMKKEILDLSTKIPMIPKELTEIAAAAGQAGIARKEIIGFSTDAAKMGIAFDTTAAQAGEWLAKWRTSFGLTQEQVVELSDKINYLGNTSAANTQQISSIVTKVGPLGEVAGFASGEVAALGATLVAVGVSEDVAATGIKKVMTTMTAGNAATKRQRAVLDKLGISATELAERMQKDAKGALLDFMKAVNKLPEAEKTAALKNYFGEESVAALSPMLTKLNLLEEQLNKVGDASLYAGSMEEEYASRAGTTENKVQLAKNSITRLSVILGNTFLPYVGKAAEKLSELVTKFADFAEKNPELIETVAKVAAGLLAFKVATITAKLGFLELKGGVLGVQKVFSLFRGRAAVAGVEAMGLSSRLTTAGAGLRNYFGGIRGALGGVGSAIGQIFSGGRIATIFSGIGNAVTGIFGGVGSRILGVFGGMGGRITSIFSGVGSRIIAGPLGRIGMMVAKPFMSIGKLISPLMNLGGAILGPFSGIFGKIFPVVGVVMLIISAIQILRDNLDGVRGVVERVFGEAGLKVFNKVVATIGNIGNAIKNVFSDGGIQNIRKFINDTFGENNPALAEFLNGFVTVFQTIGNIVGQFITFVDTYVKPVIADIFDFIVVTVLPMIAQKFAEWAPTIASIIQGLWTIIQGVATAVMNIVSVVMPMIQSIITGALHTIMQVIGGLLTTIKGIINFIVGVFTGDWEKAWTGVKDIFKGIFQSLGGIVKAPLNAVISIVNGVIGSINKVGFDIPDWVPVVGGKKFDLNIPKIPMFAKGSNYTPDTFIAGEKGAELITNAKGRKVFTAAQTGKIFNNINKANTQNNYNEVKEVVMFAPMLQAMLSSIRAAVPRGPMLPQLQLAYSTGTAAGVTAPTVKADSTQVVTKITIHNQPTIHVDGNAPNDLEEKLKKNNEELLNEVEERIRKKEEDERRGRYE